MSLDNTGDLVLLYLDEIESPDSMLNGSDFLLTGVAKNLKKVGRNWLPLIVIETQVDERYELVANRFTYAACEEASLEQVWCIIVENNPDAIENAQLLAQETQPKMNLSTATYDQINAAFEYLMALPSSPIKSIKRSSAVNKIDDAPREYWKNLEPISKLKCGITRGKKLDFLKQLFYVTPQPLPDVITDRRLLEGMVVKELKTQAKKRGIAGYGKMKKPDLIQVLSKE